MARKIVIEFLGDSKDLQRAMGDAEGSTGRLSGVLGTVGKVAAVGLGAIVAGAGAVVVSAAKLEQQYSKTMNLVGAATSASAETMKDLDDLAMKMGAETAFSANEAADAMLELAKAGITTKDIMGGGLKNTLLLASAGGTELGTAATIAANAMNTFSLKGKDMASVAAALAGGANASSASVESLGQGLQQVGPAATNAGMSLQETVGALSAFDAAGIKGSDAGTSLKTMLSRLIPATEGASIAMESVGLFAEGTGSAFVKANGEFKSMAQVSELLQDKLGGLSEAERQKALTSIFGSDASRAATVLMKEGAEGINGYIKATKDQDAAQRMADASMAGSAGAMERLRGSVETLQLKIGKALAPVLTDVANWLAVTGIPAFSRFATVLGEVVPPAFEKLKATVGSVIAALGSMAEWVGKNQAILLPLAGVVGGIATALGAFAAVMSVVTTVTKAWAAIQAILNVVLMANPIGLVVLALAGLVGGLIVAWKTSDTFREVVTGAFDKVKGAAIAVGNFFKNTLPNFFKDAWEKIKSVTLAAIGLYLEWYVGLPIKIGKALGALGGTIAGVFKDAMDAGKEKVTSIGQTIIGWIADIPGKLLDKLQSFKNAGASLIGGFVDGMKNAGGVIEGIAGNVWTAVRGLLNAAIDKINAALEFKIELPGPDITINPTNIPHLAKGGIVSRPTLALIGEDGPEAVVPLSRKHNPGGSMPGMGGRGGNVYITVNGALDPSAVARQIEQILVGYQRNTGRPLAFSTSG